MVICPATQKVIAINTSNILRVLDNSFFKKEVSVASAVDEYTRMSINKLGSP